MKASHGHLSISKQAESAAKYAINKASLTKSARAGKRAIHDNPELVGSFRKALLQKLYQQDIRKEDFYVTEFVESYKSKTVRLVKTADIALSDNEPILICVVKDDLTRAKTQLSHHRQIGVRHFAYIDNESGDGTFEWLKNQDDVSLFTVHETFCTGVKNAWVRQVTDMFGYDRWYLKLDSDEFFTYPGAPGITISQYIDYLEVKSIEAVLAPMIDMYSRGKLFSSSTQQDFLSEYCYFDADTYTQYKTFHMQSIAGGPRERTFHSSLQLAKYPLVKARESYLLLDHAVYPHKLGFQTNGAAAFLLHYKFLDEDFDKFKDQIKTGVHVNKSRDQKTYIKTFEDNPDVSFYSGSSQELTNPMDLLKINICDREFFEGLLR